MGNLANREDPDEMPHNAVFHQGLHCLPRQDRSSEKEIQLFLGGYNLCSLNIYNGPSYLIVCSSMGEVIGLKRVKRRRVMKSLNFTQLCLYEPWTEYTVILLPSSCAIILL